MVDRADDHVLHATRESLMKEYIRLGPANLFYISEKTGVSQAELEVWYSQAKERKQELWFTITTTFECHNKPEGTQHAHQNHGRSDR